MGLRAYPVCSHMIKVYVPKNAVELAFIRSLLEAEDIPYFVHNDHFGSLEVGPVIELYNAKTIMVDEKHSDHAKELISDYLQNTQDDSVRSQSQYSLLDKIRMLIEVILFGWIMPGRRWARRNY